MKKSRRFAGSIRRRGEQSWELTVDLGRDAEDKRIRKFVNVKGKRAVAEAKLAEMLSAAQRHLPIGEGDRYNVSQWMQKWITEHVATQRRQRTIERYRTVTRLYINPALGHMQLSRLAPADIRAFETKLVTGGMSPTTAEFIHMVLSGALKYAVRMDVLWRNPCQAVTPPKGKKYEIVPPAIEDVRKVLARGRAEGHYMFPALHLAVTSGARRGEILGLTWNNVDLEHAAITITQTVARSHEKGIMIEPTKTAQSRRTIDLDAETVAVLRAHRVKQMEHRLMLGQGWHDDGLVFPNEQGGPSHPETLTRLYQGLAADEGVRVTRLHDLRHLHASVLLQNGENLALVSKRLGHNSSVTTADIYHHILPGQGHKAATAAAIATLGVGAS